MAPDQENCLYPFEGSSMMSNTSQITDVEHPDLGKYPLLEKAIYFECVVGPGDLL
jgi:lysine-specific demethylase 8